MYIDGFVNFTLQLQKASWTIIENPLEKYKLINEELLLDTHPWDILDGQNTCG
jgi:hypothetical protein